MIEDDSRQQMEDVQENNIYGIKLGGRHKNVANGIKPEIDVNVTNGLKLVIQPKVTNFIAYGKKLEG